LSNSSFGKAEVALLKNFEKKFIAGAIRTIPFESSIPILQNIRSKDVELTFVKNSEHRFQDPESLEYLKDRVEKMIHKVNKLLLKA